MPLTSLRAGLIALPLFVLATVTLAPGFVMAQARTLFPGLTLRTELAFETETRRNFDLDDTVADGLTRLEPRINLLFEATPDEQLTAVIELQASLQKFVEDDADRRENREKLEVKQAYVSVRPKDSGADLRLGRQQIDDEMQWLVDEELDGARAVYDSDSFGLDLSVTRLSLVDLVFPDEQEELVTNYMATARYKFGKKSHADAYVFYRDGEQRQREDDLLFFGVQSIGRLTSELRYWINGAYLTGERRNRDISAFGGDAGLIYVFDRPFEPSVTFGFAYGSGDDDLSDGKDGNFRQTGLHDNDYRFNGIVRFHYLGELVEPEISNLMVFTGGLGVRPSEKSSIDLVYHYYRQVEEDDDLGDSNLDMDPDGIHKDLGHALDLVVGYREIEKLSIEAVVGVFFPGAAFPASSGEAYFGNLEIKLTL